MVGYFKVRSEREDFALLIPACWHRQSTFGWLRSFRLSGLSSRASYLMAKREVACA